MSHRRAVALMILGALMWSIGGVISRFFQSAEGLEITFWRSVFASMTVALWLLYRQGFRAVRALAGAPALVWASGAMWAVMFTCFMVSLTLTQVANVLITQSLAPVFTALLAGLVLRKPVGSRTWAAIVVAALGICVMYVFDISGLDARHLLGVGVALGIPVAAAINWVLVQHAGHGPDLSMSVLVGGLVSAACALPLAWPLGASAHDLGLLALLGVFQLGIPCVVVMHAARYLSAAQTSLFALLEVVFGIVLTWLFGGETPGLATLVGGAAVLAALVYHELSKPAPAPPATLA